jgi:muramoyltetrapeptide carboxypeptidase
MLGNRLSPGDIIGIVSPSTPVEQESRQLKNGIRFLISMGFGVVLSKNVFANSLGYAASPTEKAADLMELFGKPAVKAIICSQGGDTANACLPYLDWQVIRDHPKIFLGISDITVLLNAIYAKTGLVTFHGNDVMWGFGRHPTAYDRQEFLDRLVEGKIGRVSAAAAGSRSAIRSGRAEGRLLGGNLRCLLKLAGTPYFPDFDGAVLFVESLGFEPPACDCMFRQLQQMGVFDQIRGVIVGYIDGVDNLPEATLHMEDVLLNVTQDYHFPILKANDFGHNTPNTTLPVGARVRMDANEREIEIVEECLNH